MTTDPMITDYARIERAIRYLDARRDAQPALAEVARHVGLSEAHFQKLFTRWAGISPKRFLQHRTAEVVKRLLREQRSVLDASYEAGLSGPSRLHDLIVNAEAVTPGEYQRAGEGVEVRYGFHPSPFGECLVAVTARGICHLAFVHPVSRRDALERLRHDWPRATLVADQAATRRAAMQAFPRPGSAATAALSLHVKGTNFQLKVWDALLRVPDGDVTTYGGIAAAIGDPKASRAVGGAVGSNPISWLIPCHRVIRSTGELGGYAWGPERKRVMLALETTRRPRPDGAVAPVDRSRRTA
ncbi:MAG: bifunctional helix-turn-helix domain-containing protein/methylated-DNA--[protein]-cysteine S-methyltransferase [Gemmatimonadetes bacterium]|nr:bifunctional helix-turn-helix domain-containing protein/methylated-DNA--[protein]-cysteine S-methyltransferase [Gemmatimonadota bacterium]MBI3569284.1 bifunctional helix-turn-helix domain-containing protein/methylated-DNA--[protein]-cysteine S-methyltransferase [Gemmatimonadota bacterium]